MSYAVLITYIGMSMEAFLQFFYAKYGMISESYALEMIGRPGYPKTYIKRTFVWLNLCFHHLASPSYYEKSDWSAEETWRHFLLNACFPAEHQSVDDKNHSVLVWAPLRIHLSVHRQLRYLQHHCHRITTTITIIIITIILHLFIIILELTFD